MSEVKAPLTEEQIQQLADACANDPLAYREFVLNLAAVPMDYNLSQEVCHGLVAALHRLTPASLELDHFKRAMTYGEKLRINPSAPGPHSMLHFGGANLDDTKRLLVHGILGKMTEALELAPILLQLIQTGECDTVNLVEELGDDDWYQALVEHALDAQPGSVVHRNVKKLAKRYKGGFFTKGEAVNRDLDAERRELEGSQEA